MQEQLGGGQVANLLTGGVDEYFVRTDPVWSQHFLTDGLGSTVALTDSNGTVATQYTYEPFGATSVSGAATSNSFQYTGRENDGTGLYFYRARYYHPTWQRFISEDPIGFAAGVNFYGYVGNNPVNGRDPTGLWSPGVHDHLIDHALSGIAPRSDIAALQQASRSFDRRTQGTEYSNMHAMASPGQSAADAIAGTNGFIEGMLDLARKAADAGHDDIALDLLGQALHPIMDSSSPMHRDKNGNPYEWGCGVRCWPNNLGHSPNDWWGRERILDLTLLELGGAGIVSEQDRRIRDAYRKVFGSRDAQKLSGRKN